MSEIPKAYEPHSVEEKWLRIWHEGGLFTADPKSPKPTYSIVIPPPNVTGALTMGHVLNNTIQDILARKARMEGREVLWLPGTDHAGIATQTVVERALKKSGDIRHRDDLGREKFLERVREWKEKHGGIIVQQLKKLGCSCDWSRERFTMDAAYSQCVQQAFVELYKKGLIYRGKRMVNWCPVSLTALSDEEVVMKEQKGTMFYFKVSVAEQPGVFLTIATTRPETIPGDTAIAVNPADPRHARFIGRHAIRPLPSELAREKKLIPIIGDEHVDFKFGTGVLKVTPAHDKADFEIGRRHALPLIEVIDPAGRMNPAAGADLKGLDRFKARQIAADKLRELGALEKEEPYTNNVGFSERADAPIEPRLSEQWFLKYPGVVKARDSIQHDEVSAPDAASAEKIRFHPQRWARVYDHWMANLEDWCISRQLWWGHRIPVWSPGPDTLSIAGSKGLDLEKFLGGLEERGCVYSRLPARDSGQSEGMAGEIRRFIAIPPGQEEIVQQLERLGFAQDPDVLDTWFSSWLWPFATMGWTGNPDADSGNETLQKFYPTTDLVTGPDIIFFWVARMIMAGYEFMGQLPFHNVYFTGIIRDKQGRKMSKSLGNSPDPLDLIAKYSADALRFGAMRSAPLGQDVLFDEQNVELGRNFCNKVWNACRFRQMQQGEVQGEIEPALLMADDKWVLLKLDRAIREINTAFCEYKFSDVTATLYRFFWSEFCDWYLETRKATLAQTGAGKSNILAVTDFVLSHVLRLLHPFLPFITEELWRGMGYAGDMPADQGGKTIMFAPWPKSLGDDFKSHYGLDESQERLIELRNAFIVQGRNLRRTANIPANKKVKFIFQPAQPIVPEDVEILKLLLGAGAIEIAPNFQPGKHILSIRHEFGALYLPVEGLVDIAAERGRLEKAREKIQAEIAKVSQKLADPHFTGKVPAAVLEEHETRLRQRRNELAATEAGVKALSD